MDIPMSAPFSSSQTTATQEEPDEFGTVQEPVLAILYDEIAQSLERQFGQLRSLNERAQQLLGFAAVILTIIGAVATKDAPTATKIACVVAILLFGLVALYAAGAWRLANWRGDPDVNVLWKHYRKEAEEHFRYQVISNRLDSIRENDQQIAAKIRNVKRAHFWLYCGLGSIAALVVLRLLQ